MRAFAHPLYEDPKHEREVQDVLEIIFRARTLDYRREKDTVPYSTKRYIPDFTFNRLGLAVEVKLCKDRNREKDMIDEINGDIIGYAGRYDRNVFVIYDLGFIRDTAAGAADAGAACRPDSALPPRPEVEVPAGVVDSGPGGTARRLSQPPDQRRGTER